MGGACEVGCEEDWGDRGDSGNEKLASSSVDPGESDWAERQFRSNVPAKEKKKRELDSEVPRRGKDGWKRAF